MQQFLDVELPDELWWDRHCPVNGVEPNDDESIDMGPEEPDEYGGTDFG